ncbi:MAG: ATP-dependent helicase HrpB, partial [Hyphomicrobiaceae bacterium]|nr:ATP-dependent helicase HrpB [Hyphomicrobiaceae bacterium]
AMRKLALPVRLAAMVLGGAEHGSDAARSAAELAMLITERGLGGNAVDLEERHERFARGKGRRETQARRMAASLAERACKAVPRTKDGETPSLAALLAVAWPDRIAMQRGGAGRFVLANGRGGVLDPTERLAASPYLVVAELQGVAANARILSAIALDEAELRTIAGARTETVEEASFDRETGSLRARRIERLGALILSSKPLPAPKGADAARLLLQAVRDAGVSVLPWGKESTALRARLAWLHATLGDPWPAIDDEALAQTMDDWLAPYLGEAASLSSLSDGRLREALLTRVPWDFQRAIDRLAPTHFDAPSGSRVPVRYEPDGPVLAIRVQELFGLQQHPAIAGGKMPLTLQLLSPAHRPIQTTRDLPGFWAGSWTDVRAEMRGRYPKHEWPEDPARAAATNRAKPRKR